MIALGIDPGTLRLGWGVVQSEGNRLLHLAHGVIECRSELALPARLHRIDQELAMVIDRFRPEVGAVETLFFHRDAQAAAKLGHARGVVLLALARREIAVAEYAPARVKRTVAGQGRADKRQVAGMVRAMLGLTEVPPLDAADALALAVTHLRISPLQAALQAQHPTLAAAYAATGRRARRGRQAPGRRARTR